MSDDIIRDLQNIFEIKEETYYEFKEVYGLTFVFQTKIHHVQEVLSSAEIRPLGIIYTENEEFYFVPLDRVKNLPEIIEEYVKNYIQM